MSSFHKVTETRSTINGTKVKNNLQFISSGIPSLDYIIGGGLPAGAIFVVEEDVLGVYNKVLIKYFLAEGVVCKHTLLLVSEESNPQNLVSELPLPCAVPAEEVGPASIESDKMKIAWRYEGLGQVESSFGSNSHLGHNFDLSKHMDADTIKNSNIHLSGPVSEELHSKAFHNNLYFSHLKRIKEILSHDEFRSSGKQGNILRICIQSLGSPIWMAKDCEKEETHFGQDLLKFVYCLRTLIRDTNAVAFITIPSHLFDDEHLMNRLLYSADNAVKIESFAGSSRETNPIFKEYHGLFHITKLSAMYTLVPFVPPSIDLAFKLKRKKFLIEKLHLPPELEESSEREQDDITATPPAVSCGGFKKKDIEF